MTTSATEELYYDPWNVDLNADPYPMFGRLRDEAPLYHNAIHDFYAVSRFEDVNRVLVDNQSFSSARGAVCIGAFFPGGFHGDPRDTARPLTVMPTGRALHHGPVGITA